MPLSEHERRQLEQIEQGLRAGDPRFAGAAVARFAGMLACSLWAVTSYRRMTGSTIGRAPATGRGPGKKRGDTRGRRAGKQAESGFMARLQERWRRRQQGGR